MCKFKKVPFMMNIYLYPLLFEVLSTIMSAKQVDRCHRHDYKIFYSLDSVF